ncbi:hypothetical protein [Hymenobacter daecheongensis]|nr:hypothetical protein [Hymenobacter daecheongensis]
MPTKTYYLDSAEQEPITLKWGFFWKNFTISKDDETLVQVAGRSELKKGASYTLSDGRVLSAQLRRQLNQEELELLLDGKPLQGSATHPRYRVRQALYTLLIVAGLNIGLGLVADIVNVQVLQKIGLGYGTVFIGLIYLGLAWWAKTKNAALPFFTAIGLMVLDVVFMFVNIGDDGRPPGTAGLFLRFLLIMLLYKGGIAARQIKGEENMTPST